MKTTSNASPTNSGASTPTKRRREQAEEVVQSQVADNFVVPLSANGHAEEGALSTLLESLVGALGSFAAGPRSEGDYTPPRQRGWNSVEMEIQCNACGELVLHEESIECYGCSRHLRRRESCAADCVSCLLTFSTRRCMHRHQLVCGGMTPLGQSSEVPDDPAACEVGGVGDEVADESAERMFVRSDGRSGRLRTTPILYISIGRCVPRRPR